MRRKMERRGKNVGRYGEEEGEEGEKKDQNCIFHNLVIISMIIMTYLPL